MNSRVAGMLALSIMQMGVSCMLIASEDSIESVLEGYESPQELFENLKANTAQNNAQETFQESQDSVKFMESGDPATPSFKSQASRPRQSASPPSWIYSTAMVETLFNDGSLKRGFGTLLKNGFYLTSSEVIYNGRATPARIHAKMQDDLTSNLMCVSQLSLKALDLDSGLALLKVSKSLDTFCRVRSETYYQDRIYKRFGVDVFTSSQLVSPQTLTYYPYLDGMYMLMPQSIEFGQLASHRMHLGNEPTSGFNIKESFYEDFVYGRAFYDGNGVFLGIASRAGAGYLPMFINRFVIQDFLCDVQEKGIIDDPSLRRSCMALGKRRSKFFNDLDTGDLH